MSDIKYFDKIIPQGYADQIEEDLTRASFPWMFLQDVTIYNRGDNFGFVHAAYDWGHPPSDWYPFIKPLLYHIVEANGTTLDKLLRIRAGMLLPNLKHQGQSLPHVDFLMPHYTACYYVSDSDGNTVIFDQTLDDMGTDILDEPTVNKYLSETTLTEAGRASPRKGSMVVFDGRRFHAGSNPQHHNKRLVITINYAP